MRISAMLNTGTTAFAGGPRSRFACAELLEAIASDCSGFSGDLEEPARRRLGGITVMIRGIIERRRTKNPEYFNDFMVVDLETVRGAIDSLAIDLPDLGHAEPISEDAPLFFDVNMLAEHLEHIATERGGTLAGFISTLGLRIRGMLADRRLGAVIARDPPASFDAWLRDYVGDDRANNGQIAIVDLSLVPSEIVHIVVFGASAPDF
jgi:uncharacterized protein